MNVFWLLLLTGILAALQMLLFKRAGLRGMVYHGDPASIRPALLAAQAAEESPALAQGEEAVLS